MKPYSSLYKFNQKHIVQNMKKKKLKKKL